MNTSSAVLVALLAVCSSACSGDGEDINCVPGGGGSASVVVGGGTSQTGFLALNDGDSMVVEFGPQGLYMLTPSVRVQGMHAGVAGRTGNSNDPLVELEAYLGASLIGGSAREYLGLTQTAAGDERLGIFMPFTAELGTYVGQSVRIHAVVTDACGASASDDLTVIAQQ